MNIIILDLEWNQPFPNQRLKKQRNVTLLDEVIQIGAVLINEEGQILSTFRAQVAAQQYKKLHPFVAKVTKLTTRDIQHGSSFEEAMQAFYRWANLPALTDDTLISTWSESDLPILKNNLDFYHLPNHLPPQYFDLQAVFACIALGQKKSLSVEKALEALAIEVNKPLHQAWVDAEYTALIYSVLSAYAGAKMLPIVADFTYDHRMARSAKIGLPIKKSRKSLVQLFAQKDYFCPSCGSPLAKVVHKSEVERFLPEKGEARATNKTANNDQAEASAKFNKRRFFACQLNLTCPDHGRIEAKLSVKHDVTEGHFKGQITLRRPQPGENSWGILPPLAPEALVKEKAVSEVVDEVGVIDVVEAIEPAVDEI